MKDSIVSEVSDEEVRKKDRDQLQSKFIDFLYDDN